MWQCPVCDPNDPNGCNHRLKVSWDDLVTQSIQGIPARYDHTRAAARQIERAEWKWRKAQGLL